MENRPGGAKPSHLLRHMAITSTIRHNNISTTSLYTHPADDELDKVYRETFEKDYRCLKPEQSGNQKLDILMTL